MRLLAERLKFRPKSVRQFNLQRKAEYLSALIVPVVPEYLERTLIAYHLKYRREMMGAFLDALGIPHEQGEIKGEQPPAPPTPEALQAARAAIADKFPEHDVQVYLASLLLMDPATWGGLAPVLPQG